MIYTKQCKRCGQDFITDTRTGYCNNCRDEHDKEKRREYNRTHKDYLKQKRIEHKEKTAKEKAQIEASRGSKTREIIITDNPADYGKRQAEETRQMLRDNGFWGNNKPTKKGRKKTA
jgi:uncharacterized Zn finger protein (UPF0148 family)